MLLKDKTLSKLKHFKETRHELGLTVAELSEKSEVSVGVISALETGKGKVPSLVNFIKLVRTLNIPKDFVLDLIYGSTQSKKVSYRNVARNKRNFKIVVY